MSSFPLANAFSSAGQLFSSMQQQVQQLQQLDQLRPQQVQQQQQQSSKGHVAGDRCAVCSDQSQGIHFGVIVCRACAAFFRRSTIAKRVYRCRFDGNCPIGQREVRCSCRACRLAKCLALGMDPNVVQKHRDQIGPRRRADRSSGDRKYESEEGEEEEQQEMKPQLLLMESTSAAAENPKTDHAASGYNNLLPPLTLMAAGSHKTTASEQQQGETSSSQTTPATTTPSQQQQQPILHFEDGKSYALLGTSPFSASSLGAFCSSSAAASSVSSPQQQLQQQLQSTSSSAAAPSLSDLLLRALPSAFSPILGGIQPKSVQTHQQTDSGNASANSSAFSSPLNPGSAGLQQHSPLNVLLGTSAILSSSSSIASPPTANTSISTAGGTQQQPKAEPKEQQPSLLAEMLRGYRRFRQLRRNAHHLQTAECPFQEKEKKAETLVEGDYGMSNEAIKTDLSLISAVLDDHFPPLRAKFSTDSKWSMLRNFFATFVVAERSYSSTQVFPGQTDSRLYWSPNCYLDTSRLDRFFAVEQCRTDPADIARVFEPVFRHFQQLIRKPMDRLGLSEEEFVGLMGILFWNDRIETLNEEERGIVSQNRERVFAELYEVCRARSGGDHQRAGQRFCTLLNLFHFCQKAALELASAFSLVKVVKKFEVDDFLHQFHPLTF